MSRFIVVLDIEDEYAGDVNDVATWIDVAMSKARRPGEADYDLTSVVYGNLNDFDLDRAEQAGPFRPDYRAGDLILS